MPPRGVHPAIELARCTAGLRPPGLEPPWRVVEAGPAKVRERRAGNHKFLGLLSAVPNRHKSLWAYVGIADRTVVFEGG